MANIGGGESADDRDGSMYVVVRDTNTLRSKKTLELAWKLPSPRRINASRYRFPSPPFCQFAIVREKGMKRFVSRMERKEIWMKIEVDCDDYEKIELF